MDVGDDLRLHAGELPPEEDELRLLRPLDEHRVRPELTELPRHAERQERVERRAVEGLRPRRRNEMEARIGAVAASRASEHP